MSAPSTHGQKNITRGFELALRLLAGESFDVQKLQKELNVSRATAYRYWYVLRSYRSSGLAR